MPWLCPFTSLTSTQLQFHYQQHNKLSSSLSLPKFSFQVFKTYLSFCGIGLSNAQLFAASMEEYKQNQVRASTRDGTCAGSSLADKTLSVCSWKHWSHSSRQVPFGKKASACAGCSCYRVGCTVCFCRLSPDMQVGRNPLKSNETPPTRDYLVPPQLLLTLAHNIFEESTSVQRLVHKIMQDAQEVLQCDRCRVFLVDEEDGEVFHQIQNTLVSCVWTVAGFAFQSQCRNVEYWNSCECARNPFLCLWQRVTDKKYSQLETDHHEHVRLFLLLLQMAVEATELFSTNCLTNFWVSQLILDSQVKDGSFTNKKHLQCLGDMNLSP